MACRILPAALCLTLTACMASAPVANSGNPPAAQKMPDSATDTTFTLNQMSEIIEQVSRQSDTAQRAEVARLKGKPGLTPGERLELAYLLSQENRSPEDLAQSRKLLDGLEREFDDAGTRLYIRLLQRTVAVQAAYNQEITKAADLLEKLKQIKKLELDLMQRNRAPAQGQTK